MIKYSYRKSFTEGELYMIKMFKVRNFKGFKNEIVLDFSRTHDYRFNQSFIKNGLNNKSIIFGRNGSGKSNLGKAIIDIARHLTDNKFNLYGPFVNLEQPDEEVFFSYTFLFDNDEVKYEYAKGANLSLLYEKLEINGELIIDCNLVNREFVVNLDSAKPIDLSQYNYNISLVLFIYSRGGYTNGDVFSKLMDFVKHMVFVRSLKYNEFDGDAPKESYIADSFIAKGKEESLRGLEQFLSKEGLNYKLDIDLDLNSNQNILYAVYKEKKVPFDSIASTGTFALVLFYCWMLNFTNTSFLYVDEFDAFYHYELSEKVLNLINNLAHAQCVVTTHNCGLMSNKLTRPDCCFIISGNSVVKNLTDCTEREIREGHNLENLYKNGAFCE